MKKLISSLNHSTVLGKGQDAVAISAGGSVTVGDDFDCSNLPRGIHEVENTATEPQAESTTATKGKK